MEDAWPLYGAFLVVLVFLSAFFSGSETAFMAVNRIRLRHARKTSSRARTLMEVLKEPERLIGTLLLCNNLVNVALSALGTALAIALTGEEGVLYATFIITLFLLVFGEITPKTIAAYHADAISLIIAPFFLVAIRILYPVVRLLSMLSRGLIAVLGLQPSGEGDRLTGEEIESIIEDSGEGGALGKDEQSMLLGVLTLQRTNVGDIMVPIRDVVGLPVDAGYRKVLDIVEKSEFSRYPVYRGDISDVLGFVHVRDLFQSSSEKPFSLRKVLRKPHFIPELRSVRQQFVSFKKRQSHLNFVVDEYGEVVGILSFEDVLEEIVGEIRDEYDSPPREVRKLADGTYLVEGKVHVRDLNRSLGTDLPEGEVRTVGGLILRELGRLPLVGDQATLDRYRLRIESLEGRRIRTVRLEIDPRDHRGPTNINVE